MSKTGTSEKTPRTWAQLQAKFYSLRPVHSKQSYNKAIKAAGTLAACNTLNSDQQDYLETLSMIIAAYEKQHYSLDTASIDPIEILKTLMEENSMNASDLGRLLGDRSLGCRILNGKRQLSKKHMVILSDHFTVNAALFLPPQKASQGNIHSLAI